MGCSSRSTQMTPVIKSQSRRAALKAKECPAQYWKGVPNKAVSIFFRLCLALTEQLSFTGLLFRPCMSSIYTSKSISSCRHSPGSTSCSWGCIQGPTPPRAAALEDLCWQGFHCCCCRDNFPCSNLFLWLWGTESKNNRQDWNSQSWDKLFDI